MLTRYIVMTLLLTSSPRITTTNNLQSNNHKSRNLNHQSVFRRFALPPGTFLIVEPEIILPAWRDGPVSKRRRSAGEEESDLACGSWSSREGGFDGTAAVKNADVIIASPFYVYFDKLGWTHKDSLYNTHHQVAPYLQNYVVNPALQIFGVPTPVKKKDDDGPTKLNNNTKRRPPPPLSELHRLAVFHKIEELLEQVGVVNGKACVLRAICELHEGPFGRFGMVGEVLSLILGPIPKGDSSSSSSCLTIYAKAQNSGMQKDCLKYARHCPHSILQWYWTFTHHNGLIHKK